MRVLKFDRHRADAALREIGFNIEEGGVAILPVGACWSERLAATSMAFFDFSM
jgi:hypothetical protein